ncbi:hypothetical protein MFLAVUS_004978 [Mucor flavus]|uniref:Uncharacterized protein n=1 Tax=Mucor flavus TaxID=439312 RepID=A0ABP9YXE5_9FUNG
MDRDLDDSSKVLEKIDVDGNTQGKNAIKNMPCDVGFCWPYEKYMQFRDHLEYEYQYREDCCRQSFLQP